MGFALPIAANAISPYFQGLLDAIGAVLAFLYKLIPNYGVAIILLTLLIRVLLLPLAVKQIRSMQAMQALQPKIKELQRKYKGNRQKLNEEMMTLYHEHGYNPLSGCFPLLAQLPVLFALYGVLIFPKGITHVPYSDPNPIVGMPQDSRLYVDIVHQRTQFLGMNLLCSAREAGTQVQVAKEARKDFPDAPDVLDCGKGAPVRIPYYLLLVAMVGTTFYQQRQMQKASPAGASQQQQQMLTRIMPLFFGFIGLGFPVGLVLYWTTTNGVQIVQQRFMLRPAKPGAEERPVPGRVDGRRRRTLSQRLMELGGFQPGATARTQDRPRGGQPGTSGGRVSGPSTGAGTSGTGGSAGGEKRQPARPGGSKRTQGETSAQPGRSGKSSGGQRSRGGARDAGSRKKRRKR